MKNAVYIISLLALVLIGCERDEPLPALGIEGIYVLVRTVDVDGNDEEDPNLIETVIYWFYEDRTFKKAIWEDDQGLIEATGTFDILSNEIESGFGGTQFELVFLNGEELIEGCRPLSEVIIQISPYMLVNEGHPCGELNAFYNLVDFNAPQ